MSNNIPKIRPYGHGEIAPFDDYQKGRHADRCDIALSFANDPNQSSREENPPFTRCTPPARKNDSNGQVSWLSGQCRTLHLPRPKPSGISKRKLADYSCGGSAGSRKFRFRLPFSSRLREPVAPAAMARGDIIGKMKGTL